MKKIVRILLKIILAGVVVLAAGLLTLRLMFPPEKIKRLTLDYAKNTFHREVSFDSVSFNIIGLTLNNFALSEDNSFEQGTFIQAQRLEAKVALWPLLKKRIEISTIALEGISLNLAKQKDGSFSCIHTYDLAVCRLSYASYVCGYQERFSRTQRSGHA